MRPWQSVPRVRRRLLVLLLQAFGLVVLLTTVLLLAVLLFFLSSVSGDNFPFRPALVDTLEGYYARQGSWAQVETLVPNTEPPLWGRLELSWQETILLDQAGRVRLDQGRSQTPRVGEPYTGHRGDILYPLVVEGVQVGTLVNDQRAGLRPLSLSTRLLVSIAFLSFFPGILTVIIALLLAQRVVVPLAEVIAAARAVAAGDLSARVEARGPDDLRDLIESFNHMASTLEQDAQDRRAMLADIAHELRTPLSIIRGRLEGIIDGVYRADEGQVVPVLEEVYLLERLVEDLRLLTLAETHQLPLDPMPVELAELAARAVRLLEAEALEKGIAISVEVPAQVPLVEADPQRLGQVISNLLSNALHYTPLGSQVVLSIRERQAGVELAVSDNGPGVPEADLAHMFERFWRQDRARTRAAGGAGLGLAIARHLVELHGGTIQAENLASGGLRVAFWLPGAPPKALTSPAGQGSS